MRALRPFVLFLALAACSAAFAQAPADNDHTLQAMRDEMARSKTRLELQIPKLDKPMRPYYLEYRLLDMDVREVTAEFGALVTTTHTRNRLMNVEARVGDYKLDSSNFISEEGFRGFIGPSGTVGIDRDYNSLRQDLWIATDQAFKEAVEAYSRKHTSSRSSLRTGVPAIGSRKPATLPPPFAPSRKFMSPVSPITSSSPPNTCSPARARKSAQIVPTPPSNPA
jgi:hypothetical protein